MLSEVRFLSGRFTANISLYASLQFESSLFSTSPLLLPPSHLLSALASHELDSVSHLTPFFKKAHSITLYMWNNKMPPPDTLYISSLTSWSLVSGNVRKWLTSFFTPPFYLSVPSHASFSSCSFPRQWVRWGEAHQSCCIQGWKIHTSGLTGPSGKEVRLCRRGGRPYITTTPLQWQAINENTVISIKYVWRLWCSLFLGCIFDKMSATNH